MNISKSTHPLSKFIDTSSRTFYITKNKLEIKEQEYKHKNKNTRHLTQVDFRKLREAQKKEKIERSKVNIIGVDEGLITLPDLRPAKNWKKLSKEEIEARNNYILNKELMATLVNDATANCFVETQLEKEKEKYIQAKTAENEIKKLNNWDVQHAYSNKKTANRKNSANIAQLTQGLDSSSVKWMMEIKSNPRELEVLGKNKYLKDFFNKIEEEQKAIFNQNMNINKKQFLFDAFEEGKEEKLSKNRNTFSNVDYYREIMKEKLKVEEFLRNDLSNLAEQVYIKKQQKKRLLDKISNFLQDINNLKIESKKVVDENNFECKKLQDNLANGISRKDSDLFSRSLKRALTKAQSKDIKFHIQQQTIEMINSTNKRVIEIKNEIEIKESQIEDYNKRIQQLEEELRRLKVRVNNRMTEHRKYYFEILKKGIDVRAEGLSWVLVRLIELKSFIENSKFPKFLSSSQIEYLLTLAYKKYELNELIKLFQVLKNKQKDLKDKFNTTHRVTDYSKNNFGPTKSTLETETNYGYHRRKKEETAIPLKYTNNFESIAMKYENVINVCLNENKEEKYVGGIVYDLKKKIIKNDIVEDKDEFDVLYFLPGSLAEFFNENKKFREYFDDILYLNNEIIKREKEINRMKKEEMENFKRNNELHNKSNNTVENEMIFAALFGNGIII